MARMRPKNKGQLTALFLSYVAINDPHKCWEWMGQRTDRGYGHFKSRGRVFRAHRFMYELIHGPIPDGLSVCHGCDNPPCCNPAHLSLGTTADNMADRDSKGRHAPQAGRQNNASKLTEDDIREIRRLSDMGSTHKSIALKFGIARTNVHLIAHRKTWKHVQ